MKSLKLSIATLAFAGGVFGAFAFSPKPVATMQSTADYYVTPAGAPTTLVNPSKPCPNTTTILCSGTFDIVGGQPDPESGRDFLNGPKPL